MSINTILLGVTILISILGFNNQVFLQKLIMHPYTVIREKQYYRMLSSGFIHNGWLHLFFNMLALYFFGDNVEYIFMSIFGGVGRYIFLIFYLTAIIVADVPTLIKNKDNPGYFSLGASGGVSAVVLCWILFFPTETIYIYFIPMPGFILGFFYIVYSYYQSKNPESHINHDAHLAGAIYGIVFTIIIYPSVIPQFIEQMSNFKLFGG